MEAWKEEMLMHDGTKGMRWHVRRYRNEDGTLTEAGRRRYGVGPARDSSPAALTTRSGLTNRTVKTSSSVKRLDNPSTDDLISSSKKLLGEPSENEKLTEQFLRDANGRKVSMDDLVEGLPKTDNLPALYNPSKKTNDFFEEKGLIIRKPQSDADDDYEEVDDDAPGGLAKPITSIIGEGKSRRGEKTGKVIDVDYEEVDDSSKSKKGFKKADDIDPDDEPVKTSNKNVDKTKSERKKEKTPEASSKKEKKAVDSDDDDVGSKPAYDPEAARKAQLQRRADIIARGKAYGTIADEGGKIANNLGTIYGKRQKMHRMNAIDYSQMSNDDLRARTERLNLERNYREAVGNNVGNHERRVTTFLETAGTALAVTGSAISIAMAIKQLRNG